MIDAHCHIEQKDFDNDRDLVIEECKKELKAIITSACEIENFLKTIEIVKKHKNFVYACFGLHPEYIKEISEKDVENFFDFVKENLNFVKGIGEVGLDYFWIKEDYWRNKQKELLERIVEFSREIKKPLVIHCRDAYKDLIKILEQEDAKKVLLHLFGALDLVKVIGENDFKITVGPIVDRSNKHKEIVKTLDLEYIMTETDSPWNNPNNRNLRNIPLNVKFVCEKIADIKKIDLKEVIEKTSKNAIEFFDLNES
ncbi:MAG: TatD family hydrolase [Candidatus Aenigmarchaeota archaeon]|nr:TatD family hydrolase [Candidatus Aenigmarchaeota archaeon]MDW8149743.1 TatD family hydrolase [Candidatus Aenigmarchaeota archaeon]